MVSVLVAILSMQAMVLFVQLWGAQNVVDEKATSSRQPTKPTLLRTVSSSESKMIVGQRACVGKFLIVTRQQQQRRWLARSAPSWQRLQFTSSAVRNSPNNDDDHDAVTQATESNNNNNESTMVRLDLIEAANQKYRGVVRLQETPIGWGVFADCDFGEGETVLCSQEVASSTERDSHTIQVDWDKHVRLDYPSHCLNHCCHASVGVVDNNLGAYDFVARRNLKAGDEITFDYDTTEWELAASFSCSCDDIPDCRGKVDGFKNNQTQIRKQYGERFIANYLLEEDPPKNIH